MELKAPRSKVWSALTTPEGWSAWFSETIDSDFQPGSVLKMGFGNYGEVCALVAERIEGQVFTYKWHPGEGGALEDFPAEEMTTVRFELSDSESGTHLVMIESGFDRVPSERRANALKMNTGGWSAELQELGEWVEDDKTQLLSADTIVRERVCHAPIDRVWKAISTNQGLESWLCVRATGTFSTGEIVTLTFGCNEKEVEGPIKIATFEPSSRVSWRWHPGQVDGCTWDQFPESESTLVEFSLSEEDESTRLKIVETGFLRIPEDRRMRVQNLNREGWTGAADKIVKFFEEA